MFTEDLGVFFDAEELGDLCVVNGQDVVGVFTVEGTVTELSEGFLPILVAATASVPAVAHGSTVEAPKGSGNNYQVRQVLPDPTGQVVRLVLEEV